MSMLRTIGLVILFASIFSACSKSKAPRIITIVDSYDTVDYSIEMLRQAELEKGKGSNEFLQVFYLYAIQILELYKAEAIQLSSGKAVSEDVFFEKSSNFGELIQKYMPEKKLDEFEDYGLFNIEDLERVLMHLLE